MKMKRFAVLAAMSLVAAQSLAMVPALAANDGPSDCDFDDAALEITIDGKDTALWVDSTGMMQCDDGSGGQNAEQAAATIKDIAVFMDDDDSDGTFTLYAGTGKSGSNQDLGEWPDLDTFDVDITTIFYVDGSALDDTSANRLEIVFGASTFKVNDIKGTYKAGSLDIAGSPNKDVIDASKATVKVEADGDASNDVIKGGTKSDKLYGGTGDDVLYGNAGNDEVDCEGDDYDAGWGGADSDDIVDCETAAPGTGNDDIDSAAVKVSYADVTGGVEWTNLYDYIVDSAQELVTGGAAGDDDFEAPESITKLTTGGGDDVIVDDGVGVILSGSGDDLVKTGYEYYDEDDDSDVTDCTASDSGNYATNLDDDCATGSGAVVYAGAGNDAVVSLDLTLEQTFLGQSGNDVLKGKSGDDTLAGGPGSDQSWGGPGRDLCGAEVMNRCEYLKR